MCANTEAADASDTSCSPERPPYKTPTRSRFTCVEEGKGTRQLEAGRDLDADILLANTYHLHVRPGDDRIARLGGLHAFIGWSRPMLTDSGGYQVFSLAARRRVTEEAVVFQSHLDGQPLSLSPESAVDIQSRL